MPYYAWSPIQAGTADKPISIKRGESVSKADLKLSDADWQALIDAGSVREKKFPAGEDYTGSAVDFVRDQLRETLSMSAIDQEEAASELAAVSEGSSHVVSEKSDKK